MIQDSSPPILEHPLEQTSAFTADRLMADVRRMRQIPSAALPPVCILDFDGDLTDSLVQQGLAHAFPAWACFHTTMFSIDLEDMTCGIIARTIGGPYAVLIAEQLHAGGAKLIIGLTSAGRVAANLPLPCLVVATAAIRDEGTSYHYLPPAPEVACPTEVVSQLEQTLTATGWTVRAGKVWTTDAPYRETSEQLTHWAEQGALAVEMQCASLFAFGHAKHARVATIAMVSNAVGHDAEQFNTGSIEDGLKILKGIACAAKSYLGAETTL